MTRYTLFSTWSRTGRVDTHRESRDEAKVKPCFAPRGEKLGKTRRREVLSKVCVFPDLRYAVVVDARTWRINRFSDLYVVSTLSQ